MKHYLILVIILFFLNSSFGQKKIEVPESGIVLSFIKRLPENLDKFKLKNLQTSTDSLNIRIWQTHKIFTLSYNDSISSNYRIHTTSEKPIILTSHFSDNISRNILNSLLDNRILELQYEKYRGIDGSHVFFEISTKDKYKVISFWSPRAKRSDDCKSVVRILNMLNKSINSKELVDTFLNSLEPGGYRWGMTSIQIDRFLSTDSIKTGFYLKSEERIKTELNITEKTNHWVYPLIMINNMPAKVADLNQYIEDDIVSFEILQPDNPIVSIYGIMGSNGVVNLKTK